MDGPYGSTWHVWVIHRPYIGHVGHTLVYGLCMGHTWVWVMYVMYIMYVMWVMYGSTVGHRFHTRVNHRSYWSCIAQPLVIHGLNGSYMGHTWVIHWLYNIYGSCMGHVGHT